MNSRMVLFVAAAASSLLVACSGSAPAPSATSPVLTACQQAFAGAAAVDAYSDMVTDLDPAVRACATVAEWVAGSAMFPAALDGADPVTFLRNRCASLTLAPACDEATKATLADVAQAYLAAATKHNDAVAAVTKPKPTAKLSTIRTFYAKLAKLGDAFIGEVLAIDFPPDVLPAADALVRVSVRLRDAYPGGRTGEDERRVQRGSEASRRRHPGRICGRGDPA